MPPYARCMILGGASAGTIGALTGLVVGLLAYPPTAWFAVFEAALPATIVGSVVGLMVGLAWTACRRVKQLVRK